MKPTFKQWLEILLVLFITVFFSIILMDYFGLIKITV